MSILNKIFKKKKRRLRISKDLRGFIVSESFELRELPKKKRFGSYYVTLPEKYVSYIEAKDSIEATKISSNQVRKAWQKAKKEKTT